MMIGTDLHHCTYVVRERNGDSRSVTINDEWSAPAKERLCIPANEFPTAHILALVAYPELTEAEDQRRNKAIAATHALCLRAMNDAGHVRKKDVPSWAKEIRQRDTQSGFNAMMKRVHDRIEAAAMAFWLAMGATDVDTRVHGERPTVSQLARVKAAARTGDTQVNDIRRRVWQHSRAVLHLAHALEQVIADTGEPISERMWFNLLTDDAWVPGYLSQAEAFRRQISPLVGVAVTDSIQLR